MPDPALRCQIDATPLFFVCHPPPKTLVVQAVAGHIRQIAIFFEATPINCPQDIVRVRRQPVGSVRPEHAVYFTPERIDPPLCCHQLCNASTSSSAICCSLWAARLSSRSAANSTQVPSAAALLLRSVPRSQLATMPELPLIQARQLSCGYLLQYPT